MAGLPADLRGIKIGYNREQALGKSDPAIAAAITDAVEVLRMLGAKIVQIVMPDVASMARGYVRLSGVQTALAHAETYPSQRQAYGRALTLVIEAGRALRAVDYHQLLLQQLDFRSRLDALFNEVQLVVVPVLRTMVPTISEYDQMTEVQIEDFVHFTTPFSASGHPTISIPCGHDANNGPIGLQLVGPYFSEDLLVRVADAFQRETPWHKRRPLP
jgi:amidase